MELVEIEAIDTPGILNQLGESGKKQHYKCSAVVNGEM